MSEDLIKSFVSDGVYIHKLLNTCIFVCIPCYEDTIGKLVRYEKNSGSMWEKTSLSYFLNHYYEDDIKELFLDRTKYDMIGKIGINFEFSKDDDRRYVLRSL